jgi:hypothetical protein
MPDDFTREYREALQLNKTKWIIHLLIFRSKRKEGSTIFIWYIIKVDWQYNNVAGLAARNWQFLISYMNIPWYITW